MSKLLYTKQTFAFGLLNKPDGPQVNLQILKWVKTLEYSKMLHVMHEHYNASQQLLTFL